MKLTDNWFTALSEGERGGLVFVNGRLDLQQFIDSGSLRTRAEVRWDYEPDSQGMPNEDTGNLIAEVETILRKVMEKDKLAILTGNYTGDGEKHWIFYTRHLPTFGERLNEALASYPPLPLDINCYTDPEWEEYKDMLSMYQPEDE